MRLLIASALLSVGSPSFSDAPALFSSCEQYKYVSGLGASVFDQDCTTAYLLPGPEGTLEVNGGFSSVGDALCQAVQSAESAALGAFGDAAAREARKRDVQQQRDALASEMSQLRLQIDKLEQARLAIEGAHTAAQANSVALAQRFETECGNDAAKDFACYGLGDDLRKGEEAVKNSSQQLTAIGAMVLSASDRTSALSVEDDQLKAEYDNLDASVSTPEQQAAALKTLADLRLQQGAVISVTLATPLVEELGRARSANSQTGISVEQMRFTGGTIYVAGMNNDGAPELVGAARVVVPGQILENDGILFVNAAGVQINLDAVSACQAFGYKEPGAISNKDWSKYVQASLVGKAYLRYNALLNASIDVHMDYEKFYELIVNNSSQNGFFKTSTLKSVQETMTGDGSLRVTIVDEGDVLTADEEEALQSGMRDRVVQRALNFLNPQYVGVDTNASPGAPTAGAPKLAAEMRKCPNQWCQVAAVVVDVANSIFGGADSRQSFVQSLGVSSDESYSKSDAYEFVTDLVFTPDQ